MSKNRLPIMDAKCHRGDRGASGGRGVVLGVHMVRWFLTMLMVLSTSLSSSTWSVEAIAKRVVLPHFILSLQVDESTSSALTLSPQQRIDLKNMAEDLFDHELQLTYGDEYRYVGFLNADQISNDDPTTLELTIEGALVAFDDDITIALPTSDELQVLLHETLTSKALSDAFHADGEYGFVKGGTFGWVPSASPSSAPSATPSSAPSASPVSIVVEQEKGTDDNDRTEQSSTYLEAQPREGRSGASISDVPTKDDGSSPPGSSSSSSGGMPIAIIASVGIVALVLGLLVAGFILRHNRRGQQGRGGAGGDGQGALLAGGKRTKNSHNHAVVVDDDDVDLDDANDSAAHSSMSRTHKSGGSDDDDHDGGGSSNGFSSVLCGTNKAPSTCSNKHHGYDHANDDASFDRYEVIEVDSQGNVEEEHALDSCDVEKGNLFHAMLVGAAAAASATTDEKERQEEHAGMMKQRRYRQMQQQKQQKKKQPSSSSSNKTAGTASSNASTTSSLSDGDAPSPQPQSRDGNNNNSAAKNDEEDSKGVQLLSDDSSNPLNELASRRRGMRTVMNSDGTAVSMESFEKARRSHPMIQKDVLTTTSAAAAATPIPVWQGLLRGSSRSYNSTKGGGTGKSGTTGTGAPPPPSAPPAAAKKTAAAAALVEAAQVKKNAKEKNDKSMEKQGKELDDLASAFSKVLPKNTEEQQQQQQQQQENQQDPKQSSSSRRPRRYPLFMSRQKMMQQKQQQKQQQEENKVTPSADISAAAAAALEVAAARTVPAMSFSDDEDDDEYGRVGGNASSDGGTRNNDFQPDEHWDFNDNELTEQEKSSSSSANDGAAAPTCTEEDVYDIIEAESYRAEHILFGTANIAQMYSKPENRRGDATAIDTDPKTFEPPAFRRKESSVSSSSAGSGPGLCPNTNPCLTPDGLPHIQEAVAPTGALEISLSDSFCSDQVPTRHLLTMSFTPGGEHRCTSASTIEAGNHDTNQNQGRLSSVIAGRSLSPLLAASREACAPATMVMNAATATARRTCEPSDSFLGLEELDARLREIQEDEEMGDRSTFDDTYTNTHTNTYTETYNTETSSYSGGGGAAFERSVQSDDRIVTKSRFGSSSSNNNNDDDGVVYEIARAMTTPPGIRRKKMMSTTATTTPKSLSTSTSSTTTLARNTRNTTPTTNNRNAHERQPPTTQHPSNDWRTIRSRSSSFSLNGARSGSTDSRDFRR